MDLYIATLAEVKADLGIDDDVDNAVLTRWLVGLQGRIDQHCTRRLLYSASETEYFDGGMRSLFAERFPIASVSSIIIDQDQAWDGEDALESDDYRVNNSRGVIVYGTGVSKWPAGYQNIRVVYAGGFVKSDGTAADYVDDGELEALRRAFLMQGEFEWRNRENLGISQVSSQGVSVQQGAQVALALKGMTFLPEVQTTLQPLRRML